MKFFTRILNKLLPTTQESETNFSVAFVGKPTLLRKAFTALLDQQFELLFVADYGEELSSMLNVSHLPHFLFVDIDRQEEDANNTTLWLCKNYPSINIVAFTMGEENEPIKTILRNGAKGYFFKDVNPYELKVAFEKILKKGYYYAAESSPFNFNRYNVYQ